MPKFIDAHPMKPFTADELNKLQKAQPDEFGVTHHDILFSEKDNKIFCVLDGPNAEAIGSGEGDVVYFVHLPLETKPSKLRPLSWPLLRRLRSTSE